MNVTLTEGLRADAETLWDYNHMGHELRPCDIGIGLGSHDIGVATWTAQLYHRGLVPRIVFTGANAPTTLGRFPRGEAVHYREHAVKLGVPAEAILIETRARNTGQNIDYTRGLLADACIEVRSAILVSRPYQQRRVFATCTKLWPELEAVCTSLPLPLEEYLDTIGDAKLAIDTMVGDTQRHELFAQHGYAIPQEIPHPVRAAYHRLIDAGFTSRLLPDP
ncbi:MAG: YdcF family protein [Pseudonocardiaceae bacterium]